MLREGSRVEFEKRYDEAKQKDRAEEITGGYTDDRRGGGGGGGGGGRAAGACYAFRDGNCNRGDSCKFSHEGGGGRGYDQY